MDILRLSMQEQAVYHYMVEHGSITTWEASTKLGVADLQGRIHKMENKGIRIKHTPKLVKNRYGETGRIIVYSLEE